MKKYIFNKELLLTERYKLKMTQKELAEQTGLERARIAQYETRDYFPSSPGLYKLAKGMNLKMEDFIKVVNII